MILLAAVIVVISCLPFFFFQAEDGIRDLTVTGVQTCALPILFRFCGVVGAASVWKPRERRPALLSMIFSRPTKAPPQRKRMFVVSTGVNSWCGCLRPPCGGTLAIVPS